MIPELGHYALILALCVAILQSSIPIVGAARNNFAWMSVARPAAQAQAALVALAFACLVWSFVENDFTVAYVSSNSNSMLPLMYRISAVWGAHEGSLLLWSFILCLWTVAVSLFSRHLPEQFIARVLAVLGMISVGFLLFMLFTSNPFTRLFPGPGDGADLNPLLQDPGLIIHPPMLYIGYVGFSVAFGFAIAALLGGNLDIVWARWSRPWTIIAWGFLTLGIALGSWWAYYELGWGGWWFWDPVENASFMPWLVGTALIHSLAATEKRNVFKNWTVLLAICAFSLSLLGTFLVRSGVITSVHAFATDPTRGVFILIFLGIVIGGSLSLYAFRASKIRSVNSFALLSRETLLLVNSVILSVTTAAVLLGTIYPLIVEALGFGKLSVGVPYFNAVFVPLMVPAAIAMAIGMTARWRSDELSRIWATLKMVLIACVVIGVSVVGMLTQSIALRAMLGVVLALWIILATLVAIKDRTKNSSGIINGFSALPAAFIGMCLAHIGFALCILGVTITSQYSSEIHKRMGVGDTVELTSYSFNLQSIEEVEGPNYFANEATFLVTKGDDTVTTLISQKRFYPVTGSTMTEAGIGGVLFQDLYVSLGEELENGDWSVRLYSRPFVRWIWLGAIFMALGGFVAASDKRYRYRIKETKAKGIATDNLSTATRV
ncbi:MAG: heme lyase CcmF/NrfE family subunit [Gammaproteobacteria bacterium]|jgi:cytochrome c-type biogenesis protein CcmF